MAPCAVPRPEHLSARGTPQQRNSYFLQELIVRASSKSAVVDSKAQRQILTF